MSEATVSETGMPQEGDFCWTEIGVNNLENCKSFYANVFGWEMPESKVDVGMEYQEFNIPEQYPMGGMYQISHETLGEGELPPPHFLNYISVDNIDEKTSKAFDLGAKIIKPPMDIPNVGRFSIIEDPAGGMVAFLSLGGQSE